MKNISILILAFFVCVTEAEAKTAWKSISAGVNSREFNCVTVDLRNPKILYVGTANGAHRTRDGGLSWQRIFTGWGGKKNIRHIYLKDDRVFLCTDKGLFVSRDGGDSWKPSFGTASRSRVFSVAALDRDPEDIFIATDRGVFRIREDGRKWQRVFLPSGESEGGYLENDPDKEGDMPEIRSVSASFKDHSRIYLGTDDGIYISENRAKSFRRFSDEGLLDKEILLLYEFPQSPHELYAVTKSKIFYFKDGWQVFEAANGLKDARSIAMDMNSKESVWIATKRGVYELIDDVADEEAAEIEADNLLSYFPGEPTIREVQERAIRYAEVHPEKIASWRRRANMSALLPRLSFGIDRGSSDGLHWDSGQNPDTWVIGPENESTGWDITFTWDLSELIWNGAQTLIDVRSKLMVQLRDDILDEINGYYFERRKLQLELVEAPPKNRRERLRKELRIRELAANIDALTGGYYSQKLEEAE